MVKYKNNDDDDDDHDDDHQLENYHILVDRKILSQTHEHNIIL